MENSKLELQIVMVKLNEFALNYDLEIKNGYQTFIFEKLLEKEFTNEDFVNSINKIMETSTTTFNKMPNLAMFIENAGKKQITKEDLSKIRTSEVMQFLANQSYISAYGEEVWSYADYNKHFDDENIEILVQSEFGGVRGLIERYRQQKEAGYLELFRKELEEMFKTQDLTEQKNKILSIAENKPKVQEIVNDLSNKLKQIND